MDNNSTYKEFKRVVKVKYIGEDGVSLFSRHDLDLHVATTSSTTLNLVKDFNMYSCKFRDIVLFLVLGQQLRADDHNHLFLHGLSPLVCASVLKRLHITVPVTRYLRNLYSIMQVSEAVHHTLEAAMLGGTTATVSVNPAGLGALAPPVKTELTQVVESLASIAAAFMQAQKAPLTNTPSAGAPSFHQRPLPPHMALPGNSAILPPLRTCIYCSDASHSICTCPLVNANLAAGLIRRNKQNQVTLPNGSFVPNAVTSATLCKHVQRYHQLYPEARALQGATVPQLFFALVHTAAADVTAN